MKSARSVLLVLMGGALVLCAASADASLVHYRWTFSAADLLNNVFVAGADGSMPVNNGLYDGARRLDGYEFGGSTFVESEHDGFEAAWSLLEEGNWYLDDFNFWGLGGIGSTWGEDYKPYEWLSATGPEGWVTGVHGSGPPYWDALDDGSAYGIEIGDPDSWESIIFSIDVLIDLDDPWWGQDTSGAPNDWAVPELTIWFGGYISEYDEDGWWTGDDYIYQGNMHLEAHQIIIVPEPATAVLLGLAIAGLGLRGYQRKRH